MQIFRVCTRCGKLAQMNGWIKTSILQRYFIRRMREGKIDGVEIEDCLCDDCRINQS